MVNSKTFAVVIIFQSDTIGIHVAEFSEQETFDTHAMTQSHLQGEVEITTYKASGPGGQHRNKTETAVRLKHLPTGIIVTASEHRSQFRNREAAWERLLEKLRARQRKPKPRIATKPTRAAKEQRLQSKATQAAKKSERAKTKRWEED